METSKKSFHQRLVPFAPYFGIVAAVLALGSWGTTNYVGSAATVTANTLRSARESFEQESRFRRVYDLVNEETQNLDHVYTLLRSLARERGVQVENERYDTLKRLEYARHGDRVAFDEAARARDLVVLAGAAGASPEVLQEVIGVRDQIQNLFNQRQEAREELEALVPAAKVYDLPEAEWAALAEKMEQYRRKVEIDMVPAMNEASQVISRLESTIVDLQQRAANRRRDLLNTVQQVALVLYVLSAVLALYGKWLEARKPRVTV